MPTQGFSHYFGKVVHGLGIFIKVEVGIGLLPLLDDSISCTSKCRELVVICIDAFLQMISFLRQLQPLLDSGVIAKPPIELSDCDSERK